MSISYKCDRCNKEIDYTPYPVKYIDESLRVCGFCARNIEELDMMIKEYGE